MMQRAILSWILLLGLVSPSTWAKPIWKIPVPNETDLARYIRVALLTGSQTDFDTAIINYKRALKVAKQQCDRQYILAALKVTEKGKQVKKRFAQWDEKYRYQRLPGYPGYSGTLARGYAWDLVRATESLPCANKRGIWKGLPQDKNDPYLQEP
jgi:hypothetical protein